VLCQKRLRLSREVDECKPLPLALRRKLDVSRRRPVPNPADNFGRCLGVAGQVEFEIAS